MRLASHSAQVGLMRYPVRGGDLEDRALSAVGVTSLLPGSLLDLWTVWGISKLRMLERIPSC